MQTKSFPWRLSNIEVDNIYQFFKFLALHISEIHRIVLGCVQGESHQVLFLRSGECIDALLAMGGEEQLYIVFLGQFLHELGEANQQPLVDRAVYLVNAQYAVGAIGQQQGYLEDALQALALLGQVDTTLVRLRCDEKAVFPIDIG